MNYKYKNYLILAVLAFLFSSCAISKNIPSEDIEIRGTVTKGLLGKQDIHVWDGTSTQTFSRSTSSGYSLTLNDLDWVGSDILASYGGNVNRNRATINSAATTVGTSDECVFWYSPGTWDITSNLDLSSYKNIYHHFPKGAVLKPANGITVTLPDVAHIKIDSISQQIFDLSAGGSVTFNTEAGGPAPPDLWQNNATPGTTSMTTAINAALDACENVKLLNQDYNTDSGSIYMNNFNTLEGTGPHSEIVSDYGGPVITTDDQATNNYYLQIRNLGITGSDTASSIGIDYKSVSNSIIENVWLTDLETGINLEGDSSVVSSYNRVISVRITSGTNAIYVGTTGGGTAEHANGNMIIYCEIDSCTNGIISTTVDTLNIIGGTIENITGTSAVDLNDTKNCTQIGIYYDFITNYMTTLDSDCDGNAIINPQVPSGLKRISNSGSHTIIIDNEYSNITALSTETGAELVDNGTFDVDTTGWTGIECTLDAIAGGQSGTCLEITRTGGGTQSAYDAVSLLTGRYYEIEIYVKSGTSGNETFEIQYGSDIILTGTSSASWVRYSTIFKASTNENYIYIQKESATAGTMLFDVLAIKEVAYRGAGVNVFTLGTMGGFAINYKEAVGTSTNGQPTFTIDLNIPSGAKLIEVQFRVDSALSHNWDAEYNDGASLQSICTNQSKVLETKLSFPYDENADSPVMDAATDIVITQTAAGNFTSDTGQIRAVVYFWEPCWIDDI